MVPHQFAFVCPFTKPAQFIFVALLAFLFAWPPTRFWANINNCGTVFSSFALVFFHAFFKSQQKRRRKNNQNRIKIQGFTCTGTNIISMHYLSLHILLLYIFVYTRHVCELVFAMGLSFDFVSVQLMRTPVNWIRTAIQCDCNIAFHFFFFSAAAALFIPGQSRKRWNNANIATDLCYPA